MSAGKSFSDDLLFSAVLRELVFRNLGQIAGGVVENDGGQPLVEVVSEGTLGVRQPSVVSSKSSGDLWPHSAANLPLFQSSSL
jgi:hypothetical protein